MEDSQDPSKISLTRCKLSNLRFFGESSDGVTNIFRKSEPITLCVDIEIEDTEEAEFLALKLPIEVTFFLEPVGSGKDFSLPPVLLTTSADQTIYTAMVGISSNSLDIHLYKVQAVLKVNNSYCDNIEYLVFQITE